ncbi:MAG: hypothetical protein QY323_04000 [Patescibacteria group bacterium]|nr:MAG: hypothetical protein QY323_04000 [Patescibacteria group bacterium]
MSTTRFDRELYVRNIRTQNGTISMAERERKRLTDLMQEDCPHEGEILEREIDTIGSPPSDAETIPPRRMCTVCAFEGEGSLTGFPNVYDFRAFARRKATRLTASAYDDRRHALLHELGLDHLSARL